MPPVNFIQAVEGQAINALSQDMAFGGAPSPVAPAAPTPAPTPAPAPAPVATAAALPAPPMATVQSPAPAASNLADPTLVTLTLNPLDVNLLGLEVQTNQIQVHVSAQPGNGELLGNLLTTAANLINLQGVNNALNNVLGNVVTLVNSASLSVSGVNTTSGPLSSVAAATTPVLDAFIAPVHLNLLGRTG